MTYQELIKFIDESEIEMADRLIEMIKELPGYSDDECTTKTNS